ncbi:HMA domain-containing protein [Cephalotus follicularis]|uniref:HMA domain-containing protein n=1 Tax=Cephalotus follicularis TaxID=3775 RepID=A0A1Q3BER4_CEPFO|nr:HMA domain-containing protein [Cephalotus follicularis]
MGAKKKNNINNNERGGEQNENNKKNNGGHEDTKKDEKKPITVVLKIDMDCDGCASKIIKYVRSFDGVETVRAETETNKLSVTGNVDPSKIRDKLHHKTKKKVDLISPQPPKKDNNNNNNNNTSIDNQKDKKLDDKKIKEKEAPVTTAILKLNLHCQGCIVKIKKIVYKTKGVHEHSIDKQKDLVTVKGTMDVKALVDALKEKLKRSVEIVPPKKEKDAAAGGDGGDANGGGKKKKGGGGQEESGGGGKLEGNRMEYVMQPGYGFEYGYPMPGGYDYLVPYHAPQMFSDENPNACSIM